MALLLPVPPYSSFLSLPTHPGWPHWCPRWGSLAPNTLLSCILAISTWISHTHFSLFKAKWIIFPLFPASKPVITVTWASNRRVSLDSPPSHLSPTFHQLLSLIPSAQISLSSIHTCWVVAFIHSQLVHRESETVNLWLGLEPMG